MLVQNVARNDLAAPCDGSSILCSIALGSMLDTENHSGAFVGVKAMREPMLGLSCTEFEAGYDLILCYEAVHIEILNGRLASSSL